jgi:uncharacterized protein involved in exopolysaccharide biosynthesis
MGKHKKNFSLNSTDFFSYVWSKRKTLLYVTLIAAIFSAIISFFITPKFKSSIVMYPSTSASISKTMLSDNIYSMDDNLKFGTEQETEQLMQVLSSDEIRARIIRKFKLAAHYKIDTTAKYWKSNLLDEYNSNIKYKRTEYQSIIVEVLDVDAETAATIANEISNQLDTLFTFVQHERAQKALAIVEKQYLLMVSQMNAMQDSLTRIRELGVINYEAQSTALNNAYAMALAEGKTNGVKAIETKMKTLAKYGGSYVALRDLLLNETKRLSYLKSKYMEAKVDAEQVIPHKFVIDRAYKSDKKAYPKRFIIVLISAISAFAVALLLMIIIDSLATSGTKD